MYVCMYVCVYVCVYVCYNMCIHYICICIYIYIYMIALPLSLYIYICISYMSIYYVCIYIYIYIYREREVYVGVMGLTGEREMGRAVMGRHMLRSCKTSQGLGPLGHTSCDANWGRVLEGIYGVQAPNINVKKYLGTECRLRIVHGSLREQSEEHFLCTMIFGMFVLLIVNSPKTPGDLRGQTNDI